MTTLSLLHHLYTGDRVHHGANYREGWTTTPVQGHPPVTEACEAALRRRVLDRRHNGSDPVRWHHCEGWAAVTDLHRGGCHDDAMDLARLLHWCDSQFTGRVQGFWEITRTEDAP